MTDIPVELEWDEFREALVHIADYIEEWQGIPVPLGEDTPLVLCKDHPLRALYEKEDQTAGVEVEVLVDDHFNEHGGPPRTGDLGADLLAAIADSQSQERIVNEWFCRKRNCRVLVLRRGDKALCLTVPKAPDRSMDRLAYWMTTIGASDAWDLEAEAKAMEHLAGMVSERQMRHYCLTGSFMERSQRSGVHYVFRRCRPTIALTATWKRLGPDSGPGPDSMRCLAVLCLHSLGYYAKSWGGCLVPTDDVLTHLIWMRGDEAGFWGAANQHDPASPEAGL